MAQTNDADRSLPDLALLSPLWATARPPGMDLQFVNLLPERASEATTRSGLPLTDLGPLITDFAGTAAIVAQLDLIICVDTALTHLAGALGKPCWVLLPAYQTDWRWIRERSDTPWYPSLHLFRQPSRGDWATPIRAMAEQLGALLRPTLSGAIVHLPHALSQAAEPQTYGATPHKDVAPPPEHVSNKPLA